MSTTDLFDDLPATVSRETLAPGAVWLHAFAREGDAALLQALEDPQSFNRTVTLITLNRLLGRQVSDAEYALVSPRTTRQKQLAALAASASLSAELARRDPATARASAHRSSLVAAERGARRDVRTRAAR